MIGLYKVNDLRHSCRVRFRIRRQSLDAHLSQSIGIAEITERFMRHYNALIRQGRQRIFIFLIQFIKLGCIGLIIFFIVIFVFRVCLNVSILNVFHFFLCVHRAEPYMGIKLAVVMAMFFFLCVFLRSLMFFLIMNVS